jgi:hypothetical protein
MSKSKKKRMKKDRDIIQDGLVFMIDETRPIISTKLLKLYMKILMGK